MSILEDLSEEECYLWALLQDDSGLDLAEFCWQEHENEWSIWRAWAYQWPWFRDESPLQIEQSARSAGKALDVDTPVPTPTGWTTMGELRCGDFVFDESGAPVKVLEVFDTLFDRPCYEITFDDGSKLVADESHLWKTWDKLAAAATLRGRQTAGPQVRTTLDIRSSLRHGQENNHRIDVAGALQLPEAVLPLPPYVLGYWLGDGDSGSSGLTIGHEDQKEARRCLEIDGFELYPLKGSMKFGIRRPVLWEELPRLRFVEELKGKLKFSDEVVYQIRCDARNGVPLLDLAEKYGSTAAAITQFVTGQQRRAAGGPVRIPNVPVGREIAMLGILGNKHIPDIYLRSSPRQRLELLQGILDTDGHCDKKGRIEITQANKTLLYQIRELVLSLGQKPTVTSKEASCNGKPAGTVWKLWFTPFNIEPFRFSRKADRVRFARQPTRVTQRRILSVEPVETRPVRCITVDSASHLFLVGETFIPTHNSLSIKMRAFIFPFLHPGQEMVIAAPELNHLTPIISLIEGLFKNTRLGMEMLPKGRNQGITHRPFQMDFLNGARIIGRIPQRDGRGMKGLHPLWLELDEGQDFPDAGWVEVIETVKQGNDSARWRVHGVTKGVRDYFYKFTQPESGWKVHHITAMARPTWSDAERQQKIEQYGSRDHPDYRRNILGAHGDASNPLFVLHRLMQCVDQGKESPLDSEYNTEIYQRYDINAEYLQDRGSIISELLQFPHIHKEKYKTFWAGMDVGFTNHPSEILVFAEETQKGDKPTLMRLVTRINLQRIGIEEQTEAILHVMRWYGVKAFSMDKTGVGLPLFQLIQARDVLMAERVKGYGFAEKILVDLDETIEVDEYRGDIIKDSGIFRNVLEYASDELRRLVDANRLRLPWDRDLIGEFQGQTYVVVRDTLNQYGKRSYSKGNFHALDAAKMAVLGWKQEQIEAFQKVEQFEPTPTFILGEW